jgi:hypothetical protein
MTTLRQELMWLDDAMEAIELRGEIGPIAELVLAGVADRLARRELDPSSAAALTDRMRALVPDASSGHPAALDELWTHTRVLREQLACRIGRETMGCALS